MLKDLCFEVIQTCPNECLFCSSNSSIHKNCIIDIELFKRTVDHFVNLGGIEEISISGGEPFLHNSLFDMVSFCKSKQIKTVIYTSGIKKRTKIPEGELKYLSPAEKRIVEMMQKSGFSEISKREFNQLKNLGLDKIVFDLQAIDVEEYNKLMGTKNYICYVLDSILFASLSGLNVDVHYIPNKINYKQFPDLIEILNIGEVKNLSILNFVPQGRGEKNEKDLALNSKEMQEFIELFNHYKDKFNGEIRIGIPLNSNKVHLCTAGYDKINIKYDGTVLPCPAFKEIDVKILSRYGFTLYNINSDLDKIKLTSGIRDKPLCKEIYSFNNSIV